MSEPGAIPATASLPTPLPTPVPIYDDSAARAQLEDLQLQEAVVDQLLAVLDEAGREVAGGAPKWVDPEVFGGTREGERMARHTIRAQVRVQEALHLALDALAQHHGSLGVFRDEVRRVEADAVAELTTLRSRVEGTAL